MNMSGVGWEINMINKATVYLERRMLVSYSLDDPKTEVKKVHRHSNLLFRIFISML